MSQSVTVVPLAFQYTDECTFTPPWFVEETDYDPALARYTPLVNGEETFRTVHLAIAAAQKSIDIICWGFQPSMYLIRDGSAPCLGELLLAKAREGVQVRILGWEMPFNTAGFAGEANLPGKGLLRLKDRAMQSSTETQYAFDRDWFKLCEAADRQAAKRVGGGFPVFVSRGFSWRERAEIAYQVKRHGLDPHISTSMRQTLKLTATHHQKSVLVDFELPDSAVGFVMGHNFLDEYWDTDKHSALNRSEHSKPAPDRGPRGMRPRQDISSQVSGPVLEHLHANFATAWHKETGEDLLVNRQAHAVAQALNLKSGSGQRLMCQLLRTQPQMSTKREIEALYLQAVNNATQFIYIENQYFRWPPLAEAIKKAALDQTGGGRDPGVHGALHLFVVTNATDDGIGAGTVNTQRMIESLGRAETIPQVTKLRRIEQVRKAAPPRPRPDGPNDQVGRRAQAKWQAELDEQIKEIEESTVAPEDIPGLKVHLCSLVAPDSPAKQPWMPVYIHSKLMIVNDVFTTHGSANINTRSMQVDSELNIAHEWASEAQKLRRRLWELHTNGEGVQDNPREAFDAWRELIDENRRFQIKKAVPKCSLVEFFYGKPVLKDLD
ncbi:MULTISPECIES: phospholipase D-like domain-containing protein [unclassified Pseudomonas]|uniref:phospholipase D-like domain-containing protein n=1 Tax=unclassified Pseudomonas TaxID=196821 RepID=UPI00257998AF|nr:MULTISPECIES: phospholipase [unclassified Pseudomonas]